MEYHAAHPPGCPRSTACTAAVMVTLPAPPGVIGGIAEPPCEVRSRSGSEMGRLVGRFAKSQGRDVHHELTDGRYTCPTPPNLKCWLCAS